MYVYLRHDASHRNSNNFRFAGKALIRDRLNWFSHNSGFVGIPIILAGGLQVSGRVNPGAAKH
jgi:hypothetical protein